MEEQLRPSKRRKLSHDSDHLASRQSSPLMSPNAPTVLPALKQLPPAILLLSLPNLLLLPPNHHHHVESLRLSLIALRKCLLLDSLAPEIECRAWTFFAEVGMKVIGGGLSQSEDTRFLWAKGIEKEVEKAISKGGLLAQKHPSLRAFRHQLIIIHAELSLWQQNIKFARGLLKRLITSFLPSDPPQALYHTYLAIISHHSSLQEIYPALSAVEDLRTLATKNQHRHIALLSHVLRLRILVAAGMWNDVRTASRTAEEALGLSYEPATAANPSSTAQTTFLDFDDPFECVMVLHTLIMGVVYHTHTGVLAESSPRLSHLHALLDAGAAGKTPEGVVPIYFTTGPPLFIQVTHPRIIFLLGFLVSSSSKRDAVGRKPKRKLFAVEGLATWEREATREISYPPWAGLRDAEEIEERQARIKADLLCELAAVSIMRSEFDLAEETLSKAIAHTRTYSIFDLFSARIMLHHAHLAHSLGQTARALQCYRLAAKLADHDSFVQVSAKLGQVGLMIGTRREDASLKRASVDNADEKAVDIEKKLDFEGQTIEELGSQITRQCRGTGGVLEAAGQVIEAGLSGEILKAKQYLNSALSRAGQAQDNHLRALILALISSHYLHTAQDDAESMLTTCETLAAGLGAPPSKLKIEPSSSSDKPQLSTAYMGNAPLGLWVGERFLELYKRAGKEEQIVKQTRKNERLRKAVDLLHTRVRPQQIEIPPPKTDTITTVT